MSEERERRWRVLRTALHVLVLSVLTFYSVALFVDWLGRHDRAEAVARLSQEAYGVEVTYLGAADFRLVRTTSNFWAQGRFEVEGVPMWCRWVVFQQTTNSPGLLVCRDANLPPSPIL